MILASLSDLGLTMIATGLLLFLIALSWVFWPAPDTSDEGCELSDLEQWRAERDARIARATERHGRRAA